MRISKNSLFLKLSEVNIEGKSRWVNVDEFKGEYTKLIFGNGADWARRDGNLAKKYIINLDKTITNGNRIDRIRLNGFNNDKRKNQIRSDIKKIISSQRCPILGTSNVEVDHKNGIKNDIRVMTLSTQLITDFQPLSKSANDAKRQHCKNCKNTSKRFDAKNIGYNVSFVQGDKTLDVKNVDCCVGCYWFDILHFKKNIKKSN